MKHFSALFVILAVQVLLTSAKFPGRHRRMGNKVRRGGQGKPCDCTLVQIHALYPYGLAPDEQTPEEKENGGWRCEDEQGNEVSLQGISPSFFECLDSSDSGFTVLSISNAKKVRKREVIGVNRGRDAVKAFKVLPGAKLSLNRNGNKTGRDLEQQDDRRLITSTGTRRVLVVRVSDSAGHSPSNSAAELTSDIFEDTLNLRNQYLACSGNQLDFVSAGVVDVTVAGSVANVWRTDVRNAAKAELTALGYYHNGTDYENIMYVCPGVVDFDGAAAVAGLGARYSQYRDNYVSDLLVQMHEVGHNLGLHHSGKSTNSYGDKTCMMGNALKADDAPQMCFNAAKSWFFGWYSDRHVTIDSFPFEGSFTGIDDFLSLPTGTTSGLHVVGKIGNYYIMFNSRKGVNSQVQGDADTVTVIEQTGASSPSWNRAQLTEYSLAFFVPDFAGPDIDLTIEVCDRQFGTPDVATVRAYLSTDPNPCNPPPPTVSPSPTFSPADNLLALATNQQDNNGADGNQFEVEVNRNLLIRSFDVHVKTTSYVQVKIYMMDGPYAGYESDASAWALQQDVTLAGEGQGKNTSLPALSVPIACEAGDIKSFYVCATGFIRYTNGVTEGAELVSDDNLRIFQGTGKKGLFSGSSTYRPRNFNGVIEYELAETSNEDPENDPAPVPSAVPSKLPSMEPSSPPSEKPPSGHPSLDPTSGPSRLPTALPSFEPSPSPSSMLTAVPPSQSPAPSAEPTIKPSPHPSFEPSEAPGGEPSANPSESPTVTVSPSAEPSTRPSSAPSVTPTSAPTPSPTTPLACADYTEKGPCQGNQCKWDNKNNICKPKGAMGRRNRRNRERA